MRGLTRIELVVSLAILGLLSAFLVNMYGVSLSDFQAGGNRVVSQRHARRAMAAIAPVITSAVPAAAGEPAIYTPAVGVWSQHLEFSSGEMRPEGPVYTRSVLRFDPRERAVVLEQGGKSTILAQPVERLDVQRPDPHSVHVRLLVEGVAGSRTPAELTLQIPSTLPGY